MILRVLRKQWFLVGLAVVVAAGFLAPKGGALIRSSNALPILVAITLFVSGWLLDATKLAGRALHVPAIIAGLLSTYAIAPAFAWTIAYVFRPGPIAPDTTGYAFLEAFLIAAAQAGTISSAIALTIAARGSQELAILLTVLSNSLTAFATPLVLEWTVGAVVSFPAAELMSHMLWVVVVPVIAGQLVRRAAGSASRRIESRIRIVPQAIILVFVYCGFGAAAPHLLADPTLTLRFAAAAALLHATLLAWNIAVGRLLRLDADLRVALVFCGSQKTLPNGIYTWERFFSGNPYGAVPVALYHVFQLVADSILVPFISPREKHGTPE